MTEKINYFAVGANTDPAMMEAITGRADLSAQEAYLWGYRISVQGLYHIPLNPRRELRVAWGDSFRAYVLVPNDFSIVKGVVWQLDETSRRLVKNWELVLDEVGPERAWQRQAAVSSVATPDGKSIYGVEAYVLTDGQDVARNILIDSENYNPYLMPAERMHAGAIAEREAFFARILTEGQVQAKETQKTPRKEV